MRILIVPADRRYILLKSLLAGDAMTATLMASVMISFVSLGVSLSTLGAPQPATTLCGLGCAHARMLGCAHAHAGAGAGDERARARCRCRCRCWC